MFAIRSKTRNLKVRLDGQMRVVTPLSWQLFEVLPHGLVVPGGYDIEIREMRCDADLEELKIDDAKAEEAPPKRRGRPRKG